MLRQSALIWVGAAIVVVGGFWLTYQFVDPAPPRTIRMATGDPAGAYHRFAERYIAPLAEQGVTLELVPSEGAIENLMLLNRGAADLAFVQGGLDTTGLDETLASLGSVYYEPIWLFHRLGAEATVLSDLEGSRIGIGGPGSGTQAVARILLEANGLASGAAELVERGFADGERALVDGELDALFVIASPQAEVVGRLVAEPGLAPMSFARADAYVRRYPFMSRVQLPEGVLDLAANRPASGITLLAVTANLVARKSFHPALVDLVLQVARNVHRAPGILEDEDEFPTPRNAILPLDDDADRYYRYGPSFLQRYLSFWTANLVDRLKIMLLPLVALLIPLVRVMPPIYQWRVRSRVYRWYSDLQALDPSRAEPAPDAASLAERVRALEKIQAEVNQVRVPLSYADELYHLRGHIELVRRDLTARQEEVTSV